MVFTEMVSADGLARGNQATLDYCAFDPSERPIGIQVFGSTLAALGIIASGRIADSYGRRRTLGTLAE